MKETEVWKAVPDADGYEVSSFGRVRREGMLINLFAGWKDYLYVSIWFNFGRFKIRRTIAVHRLVMLVFVGPRPKGLEIAHRNGVRHCNYLSNLRYCTHKENHEDDIANGTRQKSLKNLVWARD